MRAHELIKEGKIWRSIRNLGRSLASTNTPLSVRNKRAVEFLTQSMVDVGKTDYDSINRQMQMIGKELKIPPAKLHQLFVRKYGVTPDQWIAKRV